MKTLLAAGLLALAGTTSFAFAQAPAAAPAAPPVLEPFVAGAPLAMTGKNVRTFGSFLGTESVSYDAERDLYVAVSPAIGNMIRPNDGYISLINPDGTVHTLKWIAPLATATRTNGLILNDPRGSFIANGTLYVVDNTTLRMFNMADGAPKGEIEVAGATFLNDLTVAADGTVYATDTRLNAIYRIAPDGTSTAIATGGSLNGPNGIEFDADGNLVVVLIGAPQVLTFGLDGTLLKTDEMPYARMDGLVILPDGSKLATSLEGYLMKIPAGGGPVEILATGIPTAASMGYDSKRNRVIIPQNNQNAITFVDL